jgi:cytochrome c oxidase assembly protein subunit 15
MSREIKEYNEIAWIFLAKCPQLSIQPVMNAYQSGLHRFSILLAAATFFLIIAGAAVTSNEAGLSVPDWPLSYGKVMPVMKDGVFYEHGHRMVASTVGFLTVIMAVWLWIKEPRPWMKRMGLAAVGLVILQGLLGGLTVLLLLPKWVSIGHACLAQLFFSTTVALTVFLSKEWTVEKPQMVEDHGWPSLRTIATAVPLIILAQLLMGAAFRHKASGIIPHIIGALVVTAVVFTFGISLVTHYANHKGLSRAGWAMMGVVFIQLFLGIGAYLARTKMESFAKPGAELVAVTVAHVAVGALALATSVVGALEVFRSIEQVQQTEPRPSRQVTAA